MQTMQPTQPSSMSMLSVWLEPSVRHHQGEEPMSLMDLLFSRMDGLYPGRWRQNYPSEQAIRAWEEAWSEGFVEDQIDPRELKQGIANCRQMYDWPPSYKEFVRACRPYMDPEIAYREAVAGIEARRRGERGSWSHPAIYWAAIGMGQHDLLHAAWAVIQKRWEAALISEFAKRQWADIPMPAPALVAPGRTIADKEQAIGVLKEIKQRTGADLLAPRGDGRDWARQVLAGKRRATLVMQQMARRALGMEEEGAKAA